MGYNQPFVVGVGHGCTPQKTSVRGMDGWFTVPGAWYMKANPLCPSQQIVSPNADFSTPVYYAELSDDWQTFAFEDLLLSKLTGN